MNSQYLTKTELTKRWSKALVEGFFPNPTDIRANPKHKRGAPMQLYDIRRVKFIESLEVFKELWLEVLEHRIKRMEKKHGNK